MAQVYIDVSAAGARAKSRGIRASPKPATLRVVLVAAAAVAMLLAWFLSRHDVPASPDAELTRVLEFMTLAKVAIGAAALWMVSIRFRYPITAPQAFGYIVGAAIMASGPGAMWSTAHIIAGSMLFYAGLGAMFVFAGVDGGAKWPVGRRGA